MVNESVVGLKYKGFNGSMVEWHRVDDRNHKICTDDVVHLTVLRE